MRAILIFALLATATLALHLPSFLKGKSEDPAVKQWQDWTKKYKKLYATQEETEYRFNVFKKNLGVIQWMQMTDESAVYGPTQFADLTVEEFSSQYLTFRAARIPRDEERVYPEVGDLPDEWDWRTYGAVTPVRSQGSCGSCWAFSAGGNLEGRHFLKNGKLVNISTQQLVDCDNEKDEGCNGGFMEWAFEYINKTGGIMTNEDYPYVGHETTCRFDQSKVAIKVSNWTFFAKDEVAMQAALVENGPLSIALNASFLQFYLFGVFDPVWCPSSLNHGVTLVGYGEEKKPYWIIKNSWGSSWGEKGYFRMIRGKAKCGVDQYTISADVL